MVTMEGVLAVDCNYLDFFFAVDKFPITSFIEVYVMHDVSVIAHFPYN
jgi:hypothetical protein